MLEETAHKNINNYNTEGIEYNPGYDQTRNKKIEKRNRFDLS